MFRREEYINKHLYQVEISRRQGYLKENLERIKNRKQKRKIPFMFSSIDKKRRMQNRERRRLVQISTDNMKISKKINEMMCTRYLKKSLGTFQKKLYKEINYMEIRQYKKQQNLMRITLENLNMMKRLEVSKSYYERQKLLNQEKDRLAKLAMVCEFPLVIEKNVLKEKSFNEDSFLNNSLNDFVARKVKKIFLKKEEDIRMAKSADKFREKKKKTCKRFFSKGKVKIKKKKKIRNLICNGKENQNKDINNNFSPNESRLPERMKPRFNLENTKKKPKKKYRKTKFRPKKSSIKPEMLFHKSIYSKKIMPKKSKKTSNLKKKQLKLPSISTQQGNTGRISYKNQIKSDLSKVSSSKSKTDKLMLSSNGLIEDKPEDRVLQTNDIESTEILISDDSFDDIFDKAPTLEISQSNKSSKKNIESSSEGENNVFESNFQKNFTRFYTKKP